VIENISPVVMHRREFRPDSEGPGRHRGGFGQEMEIGVRSPYPWVLSAMYDRTRCPARGINGGSPGAPGTVRTSDGEDLHPKRQQRIDAEERVTLSLPGGGGFGAPAERDPGRVARDVEDGLISPERAREVYRVALMEGERPGAYAVDAEATARLRAGVTPRQASDERREGGHDRGESAGHSPM